MSITHTLRLDNWLPTTTNQLLAAHPYARGRLKKRDAQLVAAHALVQHLPKATGPRKVELVLTLGPRQRARDPDSSFKVLLDCLVQCGALVDDGPAWCVLGPVVFTRGPRKATTVLLTELVANEEDEPCVS